MNEAQIAALMDVSDDDTEELYGDETGWAEEGEDDGGDVSEDEELPGPEPDLGGDKAEIEPPPARRRRVRLADWQVHSLESALDQDNCDEYVPPADLLVTTAVLKKKTR